MSIVAARYLDFARFQIENNLYDEALTLIGMAKEKDGENSKIYELTGKISEQRGENEEAIKNYQKAISIKYPDINTYKKLILLLVKMNKRHDAIIYLSKMEKENRLTGEDKEFILRERAINYLELGWAREGLKLFKIAYKKFKGCEYLKYIGDCYAELGMVEKAKEYYSRYFVAGGNKEVYELSLLSLLLEENKIDEVSDIINSHEPEKDSLSIYAERIYKRIMSDYNKIVCSRIIEMFPEIIFENIIRKYIYQIRGLREMSRKKIERG